MIFLGVDQTGAVNLKGEPRPLPACLLQEDEVTFFYLKNFCQKRIESFVSKDEIKSLQIALDCVIGLPQEISVSWRHATRMTLNFDGFGKKPARDFFEHLGKGRVPKRQIEIICKANSVFQEKPFQRNIQTGTFRLWKEIAMSEKDFFAPLLESPVSSRAIPIYEGYPSLAWRLLLGFKTRKPSQLASRLKSINTELKWTKFHQNQVEKDPNLADAFVLAFALKKNMKKLKAKGTEKEGWIIGADELSELRKNEQKN